jgi:hypothetical protein
METLPALHDNEIAYVLAQALEKNVPVETLERIMAMRKDLKAESAQEAFFAALSEFQARCPVIKKTKVGAVAKYAPMEVIVPQIAPLMYELGFSYMVTSETFEDRVTAYCKIVHKQGHSEIVTFTAHHLIKNKAISAAQLDAGTLTYAKRVAFCSGFGIILEDEDADGAKTPEFITQDQIALIRELLKKTQFTEGDLLETQKLNAIEELSGEKALGIIRKLNRVVKDTRVKDEIPA